MPLDLSSLESAYNSLARALAIKSDDQQWLGLTAQVQEAVISGIIQCFEVAYEQSWKMIDAGWRATSVPQRLMVRRVATCFVLPPKPR